MAHKRRNKPLKRKILIYMVSMVAFSVILLATGFYIYIMKDIPSVKVLKRLENKPVSSIYGMNGELIYLIVPDNRIFIDYNKIPQHVKDAFLAAEDAEFFKHGAIDFQSVVRALWKNITSGRVVQGGSTITQQVIKSLLLGPERSILRKTREAILSYRLEGSLTKKEILNLYLNNVYMGHGVYGVEAASQIYFGQHVWNVTRAEAALLAGIVRRLRGTRQKYPGAARVRQEYVVGRWLKKFIDERAGTGIFRRVNIRENTGYLQIVILRITCSNLLRRRLASVLAHENLSLYHSRCRGCKGSRRRC